MPKGEQTKGRNCRNDNFCLFVCVLILALYLGDFPVKTADFLDCDELVDGLANKRIDHEAHQTLSLETVNKKTQHPYRAAHISISTKKPGARGVCTVVRTG